MVDASPDFPLDTREETRVRYDALDSLRGIAALAVALHHLQVASDIYFFPITRNAYLFVEFFFVLSGFVIAHAYANSLKTSNDLARFMIKRLGRVWPLHAVMLLVFIGAETTLYLASHHAHIPLPRPPFSEDRTLLGIPINLIMLNGLVPYLGAGWNAPSWSVSVELAAYLLFAITSLAATQRSRVLAQLAFMLLALLAICAFREVGRIERCIFSFFLGTFVWRLRHLKVSKIGTVAEIVAVGLVIIILMIPGQRFQFVAAPLIFSLAIFTFSRQRGRVSSALRCPFALRLGVTSYSIYMIHFFIAFAVANLIKVGGKLCHKVWILPGTDLALIGNSALLMDAVTIAYLAIVIFIARFTYDYVEKPGIAWFGVLADRLGANSVTKARLPS